MCKYCDYRNNEHEFGCPNHDWFLDVTHANEMPKSYERSRAYSRKIGIIILEKD